MDYILVVYPNDYTLTDNKFDIYHVVNNEAIYCGTMLSEKTTKWVTEDMEREYDINTVWLMKTNGI